MTPGDVEFELRLLAASDSEAENALAAARRSMTHPLLRALAEGRATPEDEAAFRAEFDPLLFDELHLGLRAIVRREHATRAGS